MKQQNVLNGVRAYVTENFLYMRPDTQLGDDDSLMGTGIIDSMGVMEVIAFLEEEFGVIVDDSDITEANLGTLNAIAAYIVPRMQERQTA